MSIDTLDANEIEAVITDLKYKRITKEDARAYFNEAAALVGNKAMGPAMADALTKLRSAVNA